MNAAELFRLRIQSLLSRGLSASGIATSVGLAAASEVWGGDTPRELPAWYVWLRGSAGAWQLELVAPERLEGVGAHAFVGKLAVRHYPSPLERDFRSFSAEERSLADAAFDATGTPRIELASAIPPSLFTVGSIEWALDLDGDASLITMSSLDRLRQRSDPGSDGAAQPAVLRDVPGWELTAAIFSAFAGLHAQVERRTATRLVLTRQPGFELVGVGERVVPHETAEACLGEALLLFAPARARESRASLLDALRDPDASVVSDLSFGPYRHERALPLDPTLPLTVSDAWFGGEEHTSDGVACAC